MSVLDRLLRRRETQPAVPAGEADAPVVARPAPARAASWRSLPPAALVTGEPPSVAHPLEGAGRALRWRTPPPRLAHARAAGEGGLVRGLATVLRAEGLGLLGPPAARDDGAPELPLAVPGAGTVGDRGSPAGAVADDPVVPARRLPVAEAPPPVPVPRQPETSVLEPRSTPLPPEQQPAEQGRPLPPAAPTPAASPPAAAADVPVGLQGPALRLVRRPARPAPATGGAASGPPPAGEQPLPLAVPSTVSADPQVVERVRVVERSPLEPRPLTALPQPTGSADVQAPSPDARAGEGETAQEHGTAPPALGTGPDEHRPAPAAAADLPLVGGARLHAPPTPLSLVLHAVSADPGTAAAARAALPLRGAPADALAARAPAAPAGSDAREAGVGRPAPLPHASQAPDAAAHPPQLPVDAPSSGRVLPPRGAPDGARVLPAASVRDAGATPAGTRPWAGPDAPAVPSAVLAEVASAPDVGPAHRVDPLSRHGDDAAGPTTWPRPGQAPVAVDPLRLVPALDEPASPVLRLARPLPVATAATTAGASARRGESLPVARPARPLPLPDLGRQERPPAAPAAADAGGDVLARGLALAEAEVDAVDGPSTAPVADDAAASTAPAAAAAPAVPSAPAASSAPDVVALADELYEEVRARLRDDLLAARERSASLADL